MTPQKWLLLVFYCLLLLFSCKKEGDDFVSDEVYVPITIANGCENAIYLPWQSSPFVLPYSVGRSYKIGLSNCGGGPHAEGEPDQFAIDFIMDIGTLVTAVKSGTIMFVEESGLDFEATNNRVVLRDEEGFFIQYQHLTLNGALVEVGDFVQRGDPIGLSGASGAGSPIALHLVMTRFGDWQLPYSRSYPITFRNTTPNPRSLIEGETYEALPY